MTICKCEPGPEFYHVKFGLLTKVAVSKSGRIYNERYMGRALLQGAEEEVERGRFYCPKCGRRVRLDS